MSSSPQTVDKIKPAGMYMPSFENNSTVYLRPPPTEHDIEQYQQQRDSQQKNINSNSSRSFFNSIQESQPSWQRNGTRPMTSQQGCKSKKYVKKNGVEMHRVNPSKTKQFNPSTIPIKELPRLTTTIPRNRRARNGSKFPTSTHGNVSTNSSSHVVERLNQLRSRMGRRPTTAPAPLPILFPGRSSQSPQTQHKKKRRKRLFENNSSIISPPPRRKIIEEPMLTSPVMPINVLEDDVPLETIQHYGENMLTHLKDTRNIVLIEEQHMREQLHENVDNERDKLPLTFLFESALRGKGASEYVAKRALENVTKIINRLLLAKQSTALNRWIEYDEFLRAENLRIALEERQKEGGAGTVVSIFNRMVQRKIISAMRKWRGVVRLSRKQDQHKAAAVIQRAYRYYNGWWNFIKVERNKRKNEQKRVAISTRLVLFEWLAKKRMIRVIAATRRGILERDSAIIIQKCWGRYWVWKSAQDDMKRRRAEACVRRMLFRRRNAAFNSWSLYSAKMKRCKQMFSKAMMETTKLRFLLWDAFTQEKIKDRNNATAASKYLRRLLNRRMAASFTTWLACTQQILNLKRMMKRALASTLTLRFNMWADFAYETKMSRLGEQERKIVESLLKLKNRNLAAVWRTFKEHVAESRDFKIRARGFLSKMLNKRRNAAFNSWSAYTIQMKEMKRMLKRALGNDMRERFERWSDWAIGELLAKKRENERKVKNALMMLLQKTLFKVFSALHINACQNIGVRRMFAKAMGDSKMRLFIKWADYTIDAKENNAAAAEWFRKWWNKERNRAFNSWKLYTNNSKRVKEMMIRAILGKRLRLIEAWRKYAVRCRVYKSQTALNEAVAKCGQIGLDALDDFPDLKQDAFEYLKRAPNEVNEMQDLVLKKATKKILDWYKYNELMALRVQCAYRCKNGRLSLHLAKIARAERIAKEEEEHRKLVKAARLVQAVYRGRLGKLYLADLVLKRKKEQLQREYVLERQAKEARERWENDQKEMLYRAKIMREVEEKKARELAEWEAEKKRIGEAWEKIPSRELGEFEELKDVPEGEYYWYNSITEVTQWSRPEDYISGDPPPPPPTEEQILAAWRVVNDETTGAQYFYNDLTEENRWDPPDGFKIPPPKGKCCECREEAAARHCKTCDEPFCVECFIKKHSTPSTRAHMFRVLKKATPDPFKCGKCYENLATYSTPNYKKCFCDSCFEQWFDYDEDLQTMGFVHFHKESAVCAQCQVRLAEFVCQQCDDKYCGDCSEKLHRSGRKKEHNLTELLPFHKDELEDGEEYCVECEHSKAELLCEQCGDNYCTRCYKRTHARGRKAQHTTITWEEAQTPWEEFFDEDEGRTVYYNSKTRERTFVKPAALLWGKEKMAWQEEHNEGVERAKEAAEQMAEMQRQMAEMQDKMAGMQKKRPGMIWGMLKKAAKAVAPSLAIDEAAREEQEKADEDFLANYDHTKSLSPGDAARARKLRQKKRKKEGTTRQKKSLLMKALKNPKGALGNPLGFLKEGENEQQGLDEKYLRKMLIGRTDAASDPNLSPEKRKDAELAAYESSMMSYLAKARAEGREVEFKNEVKKVKEMRMEEIKKDKTAKKKKSRFN
jgi:hypothetical protein